MKISTLHVKTDRSNPVEEDGEQVGSSGREIAGVFATAK
jgi:hypothetical protein